MALLSMLPGPRQWSALLSLALWQATGSAGDSAADYYVRNLPGLPTDSTPIKMHAGHIEITPEHNGNLFFWHFENQHIADKQRTVIWINGGPGCSSEDGAMMEIGPYRVKDEKTLVPNNGSWNEFANLLFVDNPVGTGFSYVDTDSFVHELDDMADQFVQFLEKWFELFPQYDTDDIYISGESYAGQHIPYIAKAILARNKKNPQTPWNLKGLLIGNGWISPREQYPAYISFAVDKGIIKKGSDEHQQLKHELRICEKRMATEPGRVDYSECEAILSSILRLTKSGNGNDACINMYDVRLKDSYPSCGMNWPPDLKHVGPYLRRDDVVRALHVSEQKNTGWQECNGAVGNAFSAKNSKPAVDYLPDLLADIPILLFSGAEDLICNHIGTEEMLNKMKWNGGRGFEVTPGNWAPRRDWTFEGEAAGFWQEARNLTYVLFYNSSHMVPFDLPRRSRDMLDRFMGINIDHIGGDPADSRIDGEKGPETTVGGATNNTQSAQDDQQKKLEEAKWAAYQKSGEVVLVIVAVAATAWAYFIWRERRKVATYHALAGNDSSGRLDGLRAKQGPGDLEAAAFDESELDDLHVETPTVAGRAEYAVGDDSDSDSDNEKNHTSGRSR
ncbi:pheromone-processing carboxypeptidase KEX1 [Ilyonectria robusta]|uniref:pheromone-processing carboxypeptidase KEX1 n=1 Tax=Ilyonectria robusta TaxID=1079257 RepID=UPI001E8E75A8|nr:pheromone-processing carboxypeptidase KEX1 [Ilyonectria robusta]KAH8699620.1 pheromone-processing carboxypeptidase KEX1 [Ilyonectria robusta]